MNRLLLLIALLVSGCSTQGGKWAKVVDRECHFNASDQEIAWSNVISHVRSEYPKHATFCELEEPASKQRFLVVDGECRVYLGCSKAVDREFLTHGDMLVVVNEETQEVIKAYGLKW